MKRFEQFINNWYGVFQLTFAILELTLLVLILRSIH